MPTFTALTPKKMLQGDANTSARRLYESLNSSEHEEPAIAAHNALKTHGVDTTDLAFGRELMLHIKSKAARFIGQLVTKPDPAVAPDIETEKNNSRILIPDSVLPPMAAGLTIKELAKDRKQGDAPKLGLY